MFERAIVVEGPEDVAVLREFLRSLGGELAPPYGVRMEARREVFMRHGDVRVRVLSADGKSKLAQRALDVSSAALRPDAIAVCFDPDADPVASEFSFFLQAVRALPRASIRVVSEATFRLEHKKEAYTVVPAPWRSDDDAAFDGLPHEHNLERVLISGILDARDNVTLAEETIRAVDAATRAICALHPKHGWKRAFRIFGAALGPDAEAFVERLMQSHEYGRYVHTFVKRSRVGQVVERLVSPEGFA